MGRPKRYGLLCCFGRKTGLHFTHFGLESGMVFNGSTGVFEGLDLLFQFQIRLGSYLRQIFEMSEDIADNFVAELVRDN